jgi:hypothetical protein
MRPEEERVKHFEMILAVVTRLAGNSFAIKGWSITLVSALFALAAKDANLRYSAIALLPALCFWGLDAYYLRQERLFRKLYDAVRTNEAVGDPPTAIEAFSMNTKALTPFVDAWARTLFSKSIFWIHAPIAAAVLTVTIYASTR